MKRINEVYDEVYENWYGGQRYKAGLYGPDYGNIPCLRPDGDLAGDVSKAIGKDPSLAETKIDVTVREGVVRLRGQVRTLQQKRKAADASWAVPGIVDLRNELRAEEVD